ncbi:multiprotein-bridging factor 1 family protein [Agromyces sp. NPDC058104]|uniref:helix-turn-helix domain-containing protein n=1 Tax=Agromyces sp. NPDC058104 TaxID=3346342 RepID=UPI0036D7E13B
MVDAHEDFAAEIDQAVAKNVKRAREQIGWSQEELASQLRTLGVAGVHQTTIARIESGQRSLRVAEALALARLLDYRVEELAMSSATASLRESYRELQKRLDAFEKAGRSLMYTRQSIAESLDARFPGYGDDESYTSEVLSAVNPETYNMLDELLYTNSSPAMRLNSMYYSWRRDGAFPFQPWVMSRQLEVYEDTMSNGWGALKVIERMSEPDSLFEREVLARFGAGDGEHQEAP